MPLRMIFIFDFVLLLLLLLFLRGMQAPIDQKEDVKHAGLSSAR